MAYMRPITFDLEMLQALIQEGTDVNEWSDVCCNTALHHAACARDDVEVLHTLLQAGARVNAPNEGGETPLHFAAAHVCPRVVQALLEAGAKVDAQNMCGRTALHTCSRNFCVAEPEDLEHVVRALLDAGADINSKDKDGQTPLFHALVEDRRRMFLVLLRAGANVHEPNEAGDTPLHRAAADVCAHMVDELLEAGAKVDVQNKWGRTALHMLGAVVNFDSTYLEPEDVEYVASVLLDAGADINSKDKEGCTPLHLALAWRKIVVVRVLLGAGANVNEPNEAGYTPLHWAVAHVLTAEEVQELLQAGAKVDAQDNEGCTALHRIGSLAVQIANDFPDDVEAVARALLDAGAPINAANKHGSTPLHAAVELGTLPLVRALVNAGADTSCQDAEHLTPLHRAVLRGRTARAAVVQLLLEAGADTSHATRVTQLYGCAVGGLTALHLATGSSLASCEVLQLMLRAGCDTEAVAADGDTALHRAALHSQVPQVQALLQAGAKVDVQDKRGQTPLHKAAILWKDLDNDRKSMQDTLAVMQMLIDAGAKLEARDLDGRTPLHCATEWRDEPQIALRLLHAGANLSAKDKGGSTPLDLARSMGNAWIIETLEQHAKARGSRATRTTAARLAKQTSSRVAALAPVKAQTYVPTPDMLLPGSFATVDYPVGYSPSDNPAAPVLLPAYYTLWVMWCEGEAMVLPDSYISIAKKLQELGSKPATPCVLPCAVGLPPGFKLRKLQYGSGFGLNAPCRPPLEEAQKLPLCLLALEGGRTVLQLQPPGTKTATATQGAKTLAAASEGLTQQASNRKGNKKKKKAGKASEAAGPGQQQEDGAALLPAPPDSHPPDPTSDIALQPQGSPAGAAGTDEDPQPASDTLVAAGDDAGSEECRHCSRPQPPHPWADDPCDRGSSSSAAQPAATAADLMQRYPVRRKRPQVQVHQPSGEPQPGGSQGAGPEGQAQQQVQQQGAGQADSAADGMDGAAEPGQEGQEGQGLQAQQQVQQLGTGQEGSEADHMDSTTADDAADDEVVQLMKLLAMPLGPTMADCSNGSSSTPAPQQPGPTLLPVQQDMPGHVSAGAAVPQLPIPIPAPIPTPGRVPQLGPVSGGGASCPMPQTGLGSSLGSAGSSGSSSSKTAAVHAAAVPELAQSAAPSGCSGGSSSSAAPLLPLMPIPIPVPIPGATAGPGPGPAAADSSSSGGNGGVAATLAVCGAELPEPTASSSSSSSNAGVLLCPSPLVPQTDVLALPPGGGQALPPWLSGLTRVFEPQRAGSSAWWWIDGSTGAVQGPTHPYCMIMAITNSQLGPSSLVCGSEGDVLQPPPLPLFQPLGLVLQLAAAGRHYQLATRQECEAIRAAAVPWQ